MIKKWFREFSNGKDKTNRKKLDELINKMIHFDKYNENKLKYIQIIMII